MKRCIPLFFPLSLIGCSLNLFQNQLNQLPPPLITFGEGALRAYYCGYGDSSYEIEDALVFQEPGTPVSYAEALDQCESIAQNSDTSVYCEWDEKPIFLFETTPGQCDDARFGGEPGDGVCGLDPELNIIGSYTSRAEGGGGSDNPINIHIERATPQVLVLSTYERGDWNITTAPGAQLQKIIVTGYEAQTITAPPGVPVETHSYEESQDFYVGCPGPFPDSTPFSGCTTSLFFQRIEELTNLEITSYHNCYHLTDLTLHSDLSATSNCTNAEDQREYYDEGDYTATSYLDPDCDIAPQDPPCDDPKNTKDR